MGRPLLPILERFMKKFTRTPTCWNWKGVLNKDGYGQFTIYKNGNGSRQVFLAHRIAWELFIGAIPNSICVLHHCDNPRCVNPGHLFLGTRYDNVQDMVSKGRQRHTLTKEELQQVRERYQNGESQRRIALSLHVSRKVIQYTVTHNAGHPLRLVRRNIFN